MDTIKKMNPWSRLASHRNQGSWCQFWPPWSFLTIISTIHLPEASTAYLHRISCSLWNERRALFGSRGTPASSPVVCKMRTIKTTWQNQHPQRLHVQAREERLHVHKPVNLSLLFSFLILLLLISHELPRCLERYYKPKSWIQDYSFVYQLKKH